MPLPSTSVKPPWTRPPGARAAARAATAGCLILCLIAVALARPESARAASTPAVSAMNGWSLHSLSAAGLNTQLALMESEGVRMLRVDASWSSIQPQAPTTAGPGYRWTAEDAEVAALAAHHIQWLPIIDYSAPWAALTPGDWRSPPADDTKFGAFAAAVAARYGPGGTFWLANPQLPYEPVSAFEIWNEENGDYFWDTGPNPAGYAQLYLAARRAIHAVDPAATVMVGGLTNPRLGMGALEFISDMFKQDPGLAGNVDAIGLHPYAAGAQGVVENVAEARALLDSLGQDGTTIDITEFGWPVGASALAEQARAQMMSAVAQWLGNSNCGVGLIAPYDWMDPTPSGGQDWGLAGASGLRPAGVSWFAALAAAGQRAQMTPCQAPPASTASGAPAAASAAPTTAAAAPAAAATAPTATAPRPATATGASPPPSAAPIPQILSAVPSRVATSPRSAHVARRTASARHRRTAHRRRARAHSRHATARRRPR